MAGEMRATLLHPGGPGQGAHGPGPAAGLPGDFGRRFGPVAASRSLGTGPLLPGGVRQGFGSGRTASFHLATRGPGRPDGAFTGNRLLRLFQDAQHQACGATGNQRPGNPQGIQGSLQEAPGGNEEASAPGWGQEHRGSASHGRPAAGAGQGSGKPT